jgi:hypothetical protein
VDNSDDSGVSAADALSTAEGPSVSARLNYNSTESWTLICHNLTILHGCSRTAAEIASEYQRIRSRVKEDPGTAGDQGEENWAAVLREYLPQTYHVRTKGRIVAANGKASRQVDVLVLSPSYPLALLDTKMYVAAGVLAAFECKITLRRKHIDSAVQRAAELSLLVRSDQHINRHIIYGLLAHSHALPDKRTTAGRSLTTTLIAADKKHVNDPRESLDLICVADLGMWEIGRRIIPGTKDIIVENAFFRILPEPEAPVGVFITSLLRELGTSDPALGSIASYFVRAVPAGLEVAIASRHWHFADIPPNL